MEKQLHWNLGRTTIVYTRPALACKVWKMFILAIGIRALAAPSTDVSNICASEDRHDRGRIGRELVVPPAVRM